MYEVHVVTMAGHILKMREKFQTFESADQWARDLLGFLGNKARFVHVYRLDMNNQTTLPGPDAYGEAPEYEPA